MNAPGQTVSPPAYPLTALIVEDNPTDVLLAVQALGERIASPAASVGTLAQCLQALGAGSFDLVLLDLGLPDSQGLDTLIPVRKAAPASAIVVLTGGDDEETGLRALQSGAEDYLFKSQIEPALLGRVVRYAVERRRRDVDRDARRQDLEVQSLTRVSGNSGTPITSQLYGNLDLRERWPDAFRELVRRYAALLEQAVEERTYRVLHSTLVEDLRALANDVATLRGGPRDVVEIHVSSLQSAMDRAPSERSRIYLEEGRILVLELMGFLAGFYRHYYFGFSDGNRPAKRGSA